VHERLAAQAERTGDRWSRAAAQRAGARLLIDHDAAIERLEAALATAGDVAPLEAARARLELGRRLRAAGRRAPGARALEEAAIAFGRLGASRWEQRARSELSPGARVPVTEEPQLTPLEERIAELAAQGMSNPEIGAELFFSRKTIERRMSAILAKLGLRSRSELPAALARLGARV
jgi:DNA-binding NarL/FixJ family response regulator